ncbi:hypothetical protein LOAG_08594 [Loa loa]|uniref:Granulins domain-containing protein n=2 Tax=Loa loa TaxID=7209 RepID=A0A1S0TTD7_LOALO|nr:hypothetical protein LOAG_08594 [Loa loa]EFO19900.2 hypothetical protein LOAG_08594 [Loa loa]
MKITHTCPGGRSVCPDSATCCLTDAGIYGCCPVMDAVCCDDLIHCCPPATKCDMVHGQCLQNEVSVPRKNKQTDHLTKETSIKNRQLLRTFNDGNNSYIASHTCCEEMHGGS